MATRLRSLGFAVLALATGLLLFAYDLYMHRNDYQNSMLHWIAEISELVLLGPGMGVLAYYFCEYIRLNAERVQIERQRAKEARLLFLGRIAACIAHEVRNPLHNLRLLLEAPQRVHDDVALAARVTANLDRINQAVEAVYQLARPGGAEDNDDVGCDLVPLVNESVAGTTVTHRAAPTIDCQTSKALTTVPATVVRMVLDNLVRNALAAGEGRLSLSLRLVGTNWCLVIRNPGTLPAELLPGTAKPRGRDNDIPDPMNKSATGLGLGLFISRHLLSRVGGTLDLRQVSDQVEATMALPSWQT